MPRAKIVHDPDTPPIYVPPDTRIKGLAVVDETHTVDLFANVCDCKDGACFFWAKWKNQWVVNRPCVHKIKVLSDLVQGLGTPPDLTWLYVKTLATRYNVYEVTSAFHKELRRGDFMRAYFWGMMLSAHRGGRGVMTYMLNIIYEETREHSVASWLINHLTEPTQANLATGIKLFCAAPKKWQLPHRMTILENEMGAYEQLADKFSDEVGKAGDVIPYQSNQEFLVNMMLSGADTGDQKTMQIGVKGLQKASGVDLQELRWWMLNELRAVARRKGIRDAEKVYNFVKARRDRITHIGYHDVNVMADIVGGESYDIGLMPTIRRTTILRHPKKEDGFAWGKSPAIPLYAQDNHTWKGKSLMKRFANQLRPGANQIDLDFRWCGAYFGVAFRHLSVQQHGDVVDWNLVQWPQWLYDITNRLWY